MKLVIVLLIAGLSATSVAGQLLEPLDHYVPIQPKAGIDAIGGLPSFAFDGTNFLAVYRDRRAEATNGFDIYATRIALDGTVLDPDGIPISIRPDYDSNPGNQYIPSVVFDGTNFFVVWVENRNATTVDYEIYGAHVTPAGQVVESGGIQLTTGASPQRMPSIAFDGTNSLIVWRSGSTIYGLRVAKDGTPIGDPAGFVIGGPGFYPYVAFDGTNYFVVWHDQRNGNLDIYGARVSKSGTVLDSNGIPICTDSADQDHATVAFNGTNYVVAWWDGRLPHDEYNTGSAYAARVTPAGTVLDANGIRVGGFARNQPPVVTAFDGTNVMIVWQQELYLADYRLTDTFGRRMAPDGSFVDSAPVDLGAGVGLQFGPSVAFGGGKYLVGWSDTGASGRCPNGCPYAQVFTLTSKPFPVPQKSSGTTTLAQWESIPGPGGSPINTVSLTSELFVGGEGFSARWDGASWSESAGQREYGSFARSAADVWQVGWCGAPRHWDGTTWSSGNCTNLGVGLAVWPLNSGELLFTGSEGGAVRFTIAGELQETLPTPTKYDLRDVWGSAPDDVYAVGEFGTVLHWDGSAWSKLTGIPTTQALNGIWGSADNNLYAVGDGGTILHYDGRCWALQNSGTTEHLTSIAAGQSIYAVGLHGTVLRWDGSSWNVENSGTAMSLYDVAMSGNTVVAVGSGSTILRKIEPLRGEVNGDANGDGMVAVGDVFYLINHLFANGPLPAGYSDVNGDGAGTVTDVFYLINCLFDGGPPPVGPLPPPVANDCP